MCIIVDADVSSDLFGSPPDPEFKPVLNWLFRRDGCVVFGGRNRRELRAVKRAARALQVLLRAGRAVQVDDHLVDKEECVVSGTGILSSNDPHVIALARVSGARTLCSRDQGLHADFKDRRLVPAPRGMVYQTAKHSHLLRHTSSCPRG